MKNLNPKNLDQVWDLVELIDELNHKKLELMDEGSSKSKIWAKIEPHVRSMACADFKELADSLVEVPEVSADLLAKARIKEMVMEYVESVRVVWRPFFVRKSFWAAATLLAVLFFNYYPQMPFFPHADAEKLTYVEVEQGTVQITRGEKVFDVLDYMVLKTGDGIFVKDGSLAQIYFMDDSRMALAPKADVVVQKLYTNEVNSALTEVEVVVNSGEVWTQVINLTSDGDYFAVFAGGGEFFVDRAADFNMEVSEDEVLVQLVKNLVSFDIESRDGFIGEGTQLTAFDDELVIEENADMSGDVWWDYNLVHGQEHIEAVSNYYISESAEKLGLLSANPLRVFKSTPEIDDAKDALVKAEQSIANGSTDEAQVHIQEYLSIVDGIVADGGGASDVKEQVDQSTKELSVKITDNQGLSVIQDALDVVGEAVSGEETSTKVNNQSNKLATVSSLIDSGSYTDALDQLEAYKDSVLEMAFDVSGVSVDERVQAVSQILDKKIEDLHILKIIGGKLTMLSDVVDPVLAEQLTETKKQTLVEINAIVVSLKDRAIGTISDFLLDVQADESVQIQVLNSLKQNVPIDFDIMKKINDIEEVYYDEGKLVFLVN